MHLFSTGGVSFCESEAVSPACRKDCAKRVSNFIKFCPDHLGWTVGPEPKLVEALLE